MVTNTTFAPLKVSDFTSASLNFDGIGVSGSCAVVDETLPLPVNIDLALTDDVLLIGGILLVKWGQFNDKVCMQVVHPIAGVLNQYVTDYHIIEDSQKQFEILNVYPAKIPAGCILRVVYTPCNIVGNRNIAINYNLHKVMV
jgi:hypothetical protein